MGKSRLFCIFVSVLVISLCLAACGGGGGSEGARQGVSYINWENSVNGTKVNDATNDFVQFESDSRYMSFGNTRYTNVYVNASAEIIFNGVQVGHVTYIKSTNGNTITGLISNNGYFLDIYGSESNLTIQESSIKPTLITVTGAKILEMISEMSTEEHDLLLNAEGTDIISNATIEANSKMNESIVH